MSRPVRTQHREALPGLWDPSTRLCVGIMALLTLVFFYPILAGKAFLWEDFLYAWYPYRQFAAVSMANGNFPFWNPYTFNGMPFQADIQMQLFYLPITALALFVHNGHVGVWWLELVNVLHYPVAGIGMFFLARSFRVHRLPALFAGIAFMLSGFMVMHAIHQVMITLVAWYPWILLLFRKTLSERSWVWPLGTALLLGHTFFAGFPQLSLFLYFFLFVFFLFELLTTFRPRQLASRPALLMILRAAVALGLSFGVTLIQLLPTIEMSRLAVRAEISFAKATEGSMSWSQLLTFLYPKFFGTADASGYSYWGPGTYWYYWETCVYIGVLPLLLSLLSARFWRTDKYVPLFLCYGLFCLLFALGGNFVVQKFFFYYVPGFSTFRNPARMTVFVAFGGALLSAFTLQHILHETRTKGDGARLTRILLAMSGVGATVWILLQAGALGNLFPFLGRQQILSAVQSSSGVALLMILFSTALLFAVIRRPSTLLSLGVPVLLFIDLYSFGGDHNNGKTDPEAYFARAEPIVRFLKQQEGVFRVNTRNPDGMIMDRNQGMVDRIFMMEGYTPLVLQRMRPPVDDSLMFDLMNVRYETVTDTRTRTLRLAFNPSALPRLFFAYGVIVAPSDEQAVDSMKSPAFRRGAVAVLEKDPRCSLEPPAANASGTARITSYGINDIEADVETPVRGVLVYSEIFYPGWRAFVDGQETEVYRADYNLRAIVVEAGRHTVSMKFEPASFYQGAIGTGFCVLLCGAGIVVALIRRSRRRTAERPVTP